MEPDPNATRKAAPRDAATAETVPLPTAHQASAAPASPQAAPKYDVVTEIGRGGMGLILRVFDRSVKREVAMKVMLAGAESNSTLRFIEEGRITGNLEHPNIVPIHDVGVDASGRNYFTMKLVKGRSLAEILEDCASNIDPKRVTKQTELLRIFLNVCHAMSFAHSKSIIHRDLKPANVMVGDFGEVLVMDWGLAKDLNAVRPNDPTDIFGAGWTMEGMALGTPAYMPPEQAKGDLSHIDHRSDIYSLGAMLYEILTLKPPVEGADVVSVMGNVVEGQIKAPELRAPNRKIPKELSAVAMKALALNPPDRYQNVEQLISDIQLFLEGRAVSAKEDSIMETAVKLFNRHRAESAIIAVALVALCTAIGIGFWANTSARLRAEAERKTAEAERARAEQALASLEDEQKRRHKDQVDAAPAFLGRAEHAVEARDFERALQDADVALMYNPELAPARMLKAQILASRKNYSGAARELELYLRLQPDDADAKQLKSLCEAAGGQETLEIISKILDVFVHQQAYVFAEDPRQSADKLLEIYRHRIDKAWPGLGGRLAHDPNGQLTLDLGKNPQVCDLTPLHNIPLKGLWIPDTGVKDLGPLDGMPLTALGINGTAVHSLDPLRAMKLETLNISICRELTDLAPLEGMPLRSIALSGCGRIHDISALAGMPLTEIFMTNCPVRDITPLATAKLKRFIAHSTPISDVTALKGMPLETVNLNHTGVTDLTPLKGAPLKECWLRACNISDLAPILDAPLEDIDILNTRITDLTPLKEKKLKYIYFSPRNIVKGIDVLRSMDSLVEIGFNRDRRLPAADFWKKYDDGAFRKP